jgi:AmmeMemoRadiSam system protein B
LTSGVALVRRPTVAGKFYERDAGRLISEISSCFKSPIGPGSAEPPKSIGKRTVIGAMAPHAGYMFSGPVAAHLYRRLWEQEPPATVVILGPNHTGYGAGAAVTSEGFQTPLGVAEVDQRLLADIVDDLIINDPTAHAYEHSIEVQVPLIQYIGWKSRILPICLALHDYESLVEVGKKIREAIAGRDDVLVLASSDISHYVSAKVAKELDGKAIDCILKLDSKRLYQTIFSKNITMCGFGPVISMIEAVKGSKATLLKYATSGDVQPMPDVVGYASISIE